MTRPSRDAVRHELFGRRERLEAAVARTGEDPHLSELLQQVDAALDRVERGTYGLCESCHEEIEEDRLATNPLLRFCLDHLSPGEQRALEQDLELASRIQTELLPSRHLHLPGWEVCYHYEAAGPVSGDYCDLAQLDGETVLFVLGDASGKGVAASIMMTHLHAIFRTLVTLRLPVDQLLERVNRIFCEAMLPSHYATLICGRANSQGFVEFANAGHCPPIMLRPGEARPLEGGGLPLGLFGNTNYGVTTINLEPGEGLLLYTDGVSEARGPSDAEYGSARLMQTAAERHALPAPALVSACVGDVAAFRSGAPRSDDLTIMVMKHIA